MCGIAGIFETHGAHADVGRAKLMSDVLRHRGPDDEGMVLLPRGPGEPVVLGGADTPDEVYRSPHPWSPGRTHRFPHGETFPLVLAHRRLSIVDLSPGGHQPMCDEQGNWVVYNGEIYNHVELRRELEATGARFATTSDTEVLLAAYRAWGHAFLDRMNGMWAFALWDAARGELFCARDRLGVKPFYYQWDGATFAFASEPKALVLTQPQRVRVADGPVHALLALDWVDYAPQTFFQGTEQLMPGHSLRVGAGRMQITHWWSIDPARRRGISLDEAAEEFAALFTSAVRIRLRADVEVGSCLSGGIDSSAVVCVAAPLHERPIQTFTCAYDEGPRFDERRYADQVVERAGARAHVVVPDGSDFFAVLDRLTYQQDEPGAGAGLYSQWKVMERAHREGLKVLLDGQGGDETLAGYARYYLPRLRDLLRMGRLGEFVATLPQVAGRVGWPTALAGVLEPAVPPGLFAWLRMRLGQGKERVVAPALRRARPRLPLAAPAGDRSALWRQLAFDVQQRFLPSLLRYEDRNSMAFSIETRLPFLDYRVVELAFALPDEHKLAGTTTKVVLRRGLGSALPDSVRARTDKMGYETPADVWLRTRFAREARERLGEAAHMDDYVSRPVMLAELDAYLAGRRDIGLQVWRWLHLDAWLRRFVVRDPRLPVRPDRPIRYGAHRSYEDVAAGLAAWT